MVPAASDRIPRVPPYSGIISYTTDLYPYRTFTFFGPSFQIIRVRSSYTHEMTLLPPLVRKLAGLGSSLFDRHYSGNRLFLSLPMGTKMFQFPTFAPLIMVTILQIVGFPHSDMHGSLLAYRSPCLFAVRRVLLRWQKPRHPPFALYSFPLVNQSLYYTIFQHI